jgi:hypothetical protein
LLQPFGQPIEGLQFAILLRRLFAWIFNELGQYLDSCVLAFSG